MTLQGAQPPMSEAEFQREDREYERQCDHREELEREDILSIAVTPWLKAVTPRRAPQPVAALLDSIRDEWEAA
jgi:hypothetical protein